MYMIPDEERPVHPPPFSYRILYVGNDHRLSQFLRGRLEDCQVTRAPSGCVARLLIKGGNNSLLLFDEVLPDTTGAGLESFTRRLPQREDTPVIIFQKTNDYEALARAITRLLKTVPKIRTNRFMLEYCFRRPRVCMGLDGFCGGC
jgi:CheY-like chemotaxis protein